MTLTASEAADVANIKNFEASYKRMWEEVSRARDERDKMYAKMRAIYDFSWALTTALRHDMGDKECATKVSIQTMDALNMLENRLTQIRQAE